MAMFQYECASLIIMIHFILFHSYWKNIIINSCRGTFQSYLLVNHSFCHSLVEKVKWIFQFSICASTITTSIAILLDYFWKQGNTNGLMPLSRLTALAISTLQGFITQLHIQREISKTFANRYLTKIDFKKTLSKR